MNDSVEDDTARRLAAGRQWLAHEGGAGIGMPVPPWDGLTPAEQKLAVIEARHWLRAAYNTGVWPQRYEADLLDAASEFRFKLYPEGHQYVDVAQQAVTVAWRGEDRWAVCDGGFCYDANGSREYESIPSEREEEVLARFRFDRDEAVRIAREVAVPQRRAVYDRLVKRSEATP